MRLFLVLWLLTLMFCPPLTAAPLVLTAEEQAWLDKHKDNIVLGFEYFFPPVEFADADGEFTGLSADLIKLIEKQLQVTFHKRPAEWTTVLSKLQTGEVYLAPALVNTPERALYTIFTPPYIQIPQAILTRKSFPNSLTLKGMAGLRVAVVRGYASANLVRLHVPQNTTIVEVANIRDGLHMLSFGVVDALVENLGVATYFQEQEGISNLRMAGEFDVPQKLCMGISAQYPLLASIITKALATIPEETHARLFDRWIHIAPPFLTPEIILAIKLAVVFTVTAVSVLAGIAWHLRRRLQEKIRDEQQAQIMLRDQLDRLMFTLSVAKAGFWESFPAEHREHYSPEWYTMLGYEPGELNGRNNRWLECVHPDDKEKAAAQFQAYLQSKEADTYESEYRMRAKNGSWRWFQTKGRAVQRDVHGMPTRISGLSIDIHEIKKAQDKAQKAQAFINAMLEQSTQFIGLIDLNGILRLVNRSALNWANIVEHEVIGQPFFSTPWWPNQAASKALLEETVQAVLSGNTVRREIYLQRPDGTSAPFDFLASPFRDERGEVVSIIVEAWDIAELKNVQEALRKSQELFSLLFELSPDMIALARLDSGVLLEVNVAFTSFTGYTRDEAIGKTSMELGIFKDPKRRQDVFKRLYRNEKVDNLEFELRHRSGAVHTCSLSSTRIVVDGMDCVLSIIRDVTQLHAMQSMMVQSEKMLSLGGIAAGIAHEINNPLGVILHAAQTMALRIKADFPKNHKTAELLGVQFADVRAYIEARKLPDFIHEIEQAAGRAAHIVRHMLDFSRRSESRCALCHLPTIIDKALHLIHNDYELKKQFDYKQIDIIRAYPEECPSILCAESEIEQVIFNIVRNAIQAMAEMSPPPEHPCIRISITYLPTMVRLEISDNGPGIPESARSRIFEPFYTTKDPGFGTGLGLSVSYFIITKGHQGQLTVWPRQGGGTVFRIDLPHTDTDSENTAL